MGSGGGDADSRKDLNLATKNSSFAGFLAWAGMQGFVQNGSRHR
jgi:hypothetical protein